MVGETGTGKTTLVQDLARRLGQKLIVLVILIRISFPLSIFPVCFFYNWSLQLFIFKVFLMPIFFLFQNLSQQSDVADLLGGFKPMDAKLICLPLYNEFEDLFQKTFSKKVLCV